MGPNDEERTTEEMTRFGEELEEWNDVYGGDGELAGSDHDVVGGTEHFDREGEYTGFTSDDGQEYDAVGNPIYDD